MSEWFLAAVGAWGVPALALATFLSCLAVPLPASMMMLAAGAFAASGDLGLVSLAVAALAGAVLGDQVGYALGRLGFRRAERWLRRSPTRADALDRARTDIRRHAVLTVFLSRWLFSVLGPYINLLAGGAGVGWRAFTLAGVAGEVIWVTVYLGLGWVAGGQIAAIVSMLGDISGFVASLAVTSALGWALWRRRRQG